MAKNNLEYNETRVKTKEDWLKVLKNEETLNKDKILGILKFIYMSKDHTSNCGTISEYMNIEIAGINSIVSSFGKRVLDLLNLPEVKGASGQNRRWNIPFKTNFDKNKNGIFTWELRPELILAIEEKYNWKEKYIIQNYGKKLIRYERYSRKDIHDIFSPNTTFIKGTGNWGRQGIIKVPNTESDFIFLVTFGSSQSGHNFVENIDENGILDWQSQPSQKLNNKRIQAFINHDYNISNIYLFLRENDHINDYSYLGKLAYISHDSERECPVYFKWQILDWNPAKGKISLDKNVKKDEIKRKIKEVKDTIDLDQIDPNDIIINFVDKKKVFTKVERRGKKTAEFNNKNRDFVGEAEKNTKLGNKGEDVVVSFEKRHLNQIGRSDLADQVMATRNFAGNAEKYDVLSFEDDGTIKYIEVKTTSGGANNPFHISENEVRFSEDNKKHYYFYRLYNFDKKNKKTDLIIIKGALNRDMLDAEKYIGILEILKKKHLLMKVFN